MWLQSIIYFLSIHTNATILSCPPNSSTTQRKIAILFIPPQIPPESAGIREFRRNPQELTGIPEFWRNPSESVGIPRNRLEFAQIYYKRYNITFGNHLYKVLTSFSKVFSYTFIN